MANVTEKYQQLAKARLEQERKLREEERLRKELEAKQKADADARRKMEIARLEAVKKAQETAYLEKVKKAQSKNNTNTAGTSLSPMSPANIVDNQKVFNSKMNKNDPRYKMEIARIKAVKKAKEDASALKQYNAFQSTKPDVTSDDLNMAGSVGVGVIKGIANPESWKAGLENVGGGTLAFTKEVITTSQDPFLEAVVDAGYSNKTIEKLVEKSKDPNKSIVGQGITKLEEDVFPNFYKIDKSKGDKDILDSIMRKASERQQAILAEADNDYERFGMSAGMSTVDNTIRAVPTILSGGQLAWVSLALAGTSVAGRETRNLIKAGYEPRRALAIGTAKGAIEIITEKIGVDNLVDAIKIAGSGTIKELLQQALRSSLSEGAEEGLSYVLNYALDQIVMEAKDKPDFDMNELAENILSGALSGLIGVGGAVVTQNNYQKYDDRFDEKTFDPNNLAVDNDFGVEIHPSKISEEKKNIAKIMSSVVSQSKNRLHYFEGDPRINGRWSEGEIWVNLNAPEGVEFVVKHELVHSIKGTKQYDELVDFAREFYSVKGEDFDTKVKALMNFRNQKAKSIGKKDMLVDVDGAVEEVVANFVGNELFSGQAVMDLAMTRRSLFKYVSEFVDTSYNRTFSPTDDKIISEAQKVFKEGITKGVGKDTTTGNKYSAVDNYPTAVGSNADELFFRTNNKVNVNNFIKNDDVNYSSRVFNNSFNNIKKELSNRNNINSADVNDFERSLKDIIENIAYDSYKANNSNTEQVITKALQSYILNGIDYDYDEEDSMYGISPYMDILIHTRQMLENFNDNRTLSFNFRVYPFIEKYISNIEDQKLFISHLLNMFGYDGISYNGENITTTFDKSEEKYFDTFGNKLPKEVYERNKNSKFKIGEKLIVSYHGSSNYFDEFSYKHRANTLNYEGFGFYFSPYFNIANNFARGNNANTQSYYLNVTNPLDDSKQNQVTEQQYKQFIDKILDYADKLSKSIKNVDEKNFFDKDIIYIKEKMDNDYKNYAINLNSKYRMNDNSDTRILLNIVDNFYDFYFEKYFVNKGIITKEDYNNFVIKTFSDITSFNGSYNSNTKETLIAWFPEQIKRVNNNNPTDSRNVKYSTSDGIDIIDNTFIGYSSKITDINNIINNNYSDDENISKNIKTQIADSFDKTLPDLFSKSSDIPEMLVSKYEELKNKKNKNLFDDISLFVSLSNFSDWERRNLFSASDYDENTYKKNMMEVNDLLNELMAYWKETDKNSFEHFDTIFDKRISEQHKMVLNNHLFAFFEFYSNIKNGKIGYEEFLDNARRYGDDYFGFTSNDRNIFNMYVNQKQDKDSLFMKYMAESTKKHFNKNMFRLYDFDETQLDQITYRLGKNHPKKVIQKMLENISNNYISFISNPTWASKNNNSFSDVINIMFDNYNMLSDEFVEKYTLYENQLSKVLNSSVIPESLILSMMLQHIDTNMVDDSISFEDNVKLSFSSEYVKKLFSYYALINNDNHLSSYMIFEKIIESGIVKSKYDKVDYNFFTDSKFKTIVDKMYDAYSNSRENLVVVYDNNNISDKQIDDLVIIKNDFLSATERLITDSDSYTDNELFEINFFSGDQETNQTSIRNASDMMYYLMMLQYNNLALGGYTGISGEKVFLFEKSTFNDEAVLLTTHTKTSKETTDYLDEIRGFSTDQYDNISTNSNYGLSFYKNRSWEITKQRQKPIDYENAKIYLNNKIADYNYEYANDKDGNTFSINTDSKVVISTTGKEYIDDELTKSVTLELPSFIEERIKIFNAEYLRARSHLEKTNKIYSADFSDKKHLSNTKDFLYDVKIERLFEEIIVNLKKYYKATPNTQYIDTLTPSYYRGKNFVSDVVSFNNDLFLKDDLIDYLTGAGFRSIKNPMSIWTQLFHTMGYDWIDIGGTKYDIRLDTSDMYGNKIYDTYGNVIAPDVIARNENSQIRDDNGNLRVAFHGSYNTFSEYTYHHRAKNTNWFGFGIYFAKDGETSMGYTGTGETSSLTTYYLNIVNPLLSHEDYQITDEQYESCISRISKYIIDKSKEYISDKKYNDFENRLENYKNSVEIYEKQTMANYKSQTLQDSNGYRGGEPADTQKMLYIIDNMYDVYSRITNDNAYEKNDYDMFCAKTFINVTRYDGILQTHDQDGHEYKHTFIAWLPEQIKRIDNENPTDHPDTKYSFSGETITKETLTNHENGYKTTNKISNSFYMLPDGTLWDGKDGNSDRIYDHREIENFTILNRYNGKEFWDEVTYDMGMIIVVPETKNIIINPRYTPTQNQKDKLGGLEKSGWNIIKDTDVNIAGIGNDVVKYSTSGDPNAIKKPRMTKKVKMAQEAINLNNQFLLPMEQDAFEMYATLAEKVTNIPYSLGTNKQDYIKKTLDRLYKVTAFDKTPERTIVPLRNGKQIDVTENVERYKKGEKLNIPKGRTRVSKMNNDLEGKLTGMTNNKMDAQMVAEQARDKTKSKMEYEEKTHIAQIQEHTPKLKENFPTRFGKLMSVDVGDIKLKDAQGWVVQGTEMIKEALDIGGEQGRELAFQIIDQVRKIGTYSGQIVELFKLLKELGEGDMLLWVDRELKKAFRLYQKKVKSSVAKKNFSKFNFNDKEIEKVTALYAEMMNENTDNERKNECGALIQAYINSKVPRSTGQYIKSFIRLAKLFNAKTMLRNFLGNVTILPANVAGSLSGAVFVDKMIGKKTGMRVQGHTNTVVASEGSLLGIKRVLRDYEIGINTREDNPYEFGITTVFRTFNFEPRLAENPLQWLEKKIGELERFNNMMLALGDMPFYNSVYMNTLDNLKVLNEDMYNAKDEKGKVELMDEWSALAHYEAQVKTWQDSNSITDGLNRIRNGLNRIGIQDFGLGDMVILFTKTPANLLRATYKYSPLAVMSFVGNSTNAKIIDKIIHNEEITFKEQSRIVNDLSKLIGGTMVLIIGASLSMLGFIELSGGEPPEEQANITQFKRLATGWQPYSIRIGDAWYSYDWIQPLGTSIAIFEDVKYALENPTEFDQAGKNIALTTLNAFLNNLDRGGSVVFEQSVLQGIMDIIKSEGVYSAFAEKLLNLPALFVPTLQNQIMTMVNPEMRNTYTKNDMISTMIDKMKVSLGLHEDLPIRYDVFGKPMRKQGSQSVFETFFSPANIRRASSDEVIGELYEIFERTGDGTLIPKQAPTYIRSGNKTYYLNNEEVSAWQKESGTFATKEIKKFIKSPEYRNLSDAERVEAIANINQYAYSNAKTSYVAKKVDIKQKDIDQVIKWKEQLARTSDRKVDKPLKDWLKTQIAKHPKFDQVYTDEQYITDRAVKDAGFDIGKFTLVKAQLQEIKGEKRKLEIWKFLNTQHLTKAQWEFMFYRIAGYSDLKIK